MISHAHDIDLALGKLRALAGDIALDRMIAFVHDGTPIPKARARYSVKHKRFFTGSKHRRAEGDVLQQFRIAWNRRPPISDTVAIVALFYVPTRHRKDVDNLMKLVMDAGTKARVWLDDSQVTVQASLMDLDAERPRTVVVLAPCLGTLTKAPLLLR